MFLQKIVNTTSKLVASPPKGVSHTNYSITPSSFKLLSYPFVFRTRNRTRNRWICRDYDYEYRFAEYEYSPVSLNNLMIPDTNQWLSHCSYHRYAGAYFFVSNWHNS